MKILAIETSCDETAVCVLEATGSEHDTRFTILGDALYSQASKHAVFGGVYPNLAKREHAENLVPLLVSALKEAGMYGPFRRNLTSDQTAFLETVLVREAGLLPVLTQTLVSIERPPIDAIAVTHGPGLEPALWVGINFARTLAYVWDLPLVPINHLEGHLVASAVSTPPDTCHGQYILDDLQFPVLGLVLSGGHTEFVHATAWGHYTRIGGTRDDSIGEAFDKVARLMDLPYPGGPELSRLAEKGRPALLRREIPVTKGLRTLPRPMLHSDDLDFSFSGLKTAVKYQIRDLGELNDESRMRIAAEFEQAVTEVILTKTTRALEQYPAHAFMLGGGVSANTYLRTRLAHLFAHRGDGIPLRLPAEGLSTDNAVMIGMAGYLAHLRNAPTRHASEELCADGNLAL